MSMKIIFYSIIGGLLMLVGLQVFGIERVPKSNNTVEQEESDSSVMRTNFEKLKQLSNSEKRKENKNTSDLLRQQMQNLQKKPKEESEGYTISASNIWNGFKRMLGWTPVVLASKKAMTSRYGQEFVAELYGTANKKLGITKAFNNVIYAKFYNDDLKNAVKGLKDKLTQLKDKINDFEEGEGEDTGTLDNSLKWKIQGLEYLISSMEQLIDNYDSLVADVVKVNKKQLITPKKGNVSEYFKADKKNRATLLQVEYIN